MSERNPVLITTRHRGVFFGYVEAPVDEVGRNAVVYDVRNCIYWSADVGGFLGLASIGPSSSCKIGAVAAKVKIFDVTSVTSVSDEAATKWKLT